MNPAGCLFVSWGWFAGLAVAGWALGESSDADRWTGYLNAVSAAVILLVALYMGWNFVVLLGSELSAHIVQ